MVTLFAIGFLIFAWKLARLAIRAAWGITKGVLYVIGIPILLIGMFAAGLATLAVVLLVFALLAAFLWPLLKGASGT